MIRNRPRKQGFGRIFVVSGPSGSGKTTLRDRLLRKKSLKGKLVKSVSLTTRPQRKGEEEGRDYVFTTKKEFHRGLKGKKFLEWTKYLGYYYATQKSVVDNAIKKGKNVILCLDYRGVLQVRKKYPGNTVAIFILPPSLYSLKKRIVGRGREDGKKEIGERLRLAKKELLLSRRYDYRILNKSLSQAARRLLDIITDETAR